jgi:glycosyltransferase involved in cell wall biosynthesis
VGGSLKSPDGFASEEGGAPWFTALRAADGWRLRHDRALRRSFSEASGVVGIADYVGPLLDSIPIKRFFTLNDTGIDELPEAAGGSGRVEAVRFLFVGRVIRTKGVRDLVRAMSMLPPGLGVLDVLGDGYDRTACEDLAAELGVESFVRFHGRVSHDEVYRFMSLADVFVFPSYREAGGIVVTEAMSYGLPVIVCDNGGPASTVDGASGIKVPARSPVQLASDVADAMKLLARDPGLRARLGAAGRARIAATALWDRRIEFVERLYESVRNNVAN